MTDNNTSNNTNMPDFGEGLRKIFLAGVGALAATAEKGQELVNNLVARGELTVEQGKKLNSELAHKANEKSAISQDCFTVENLNLYDPTD